MAEGQLQGGPQVIAPQVGRNPSTYWAALTVAENGTVVYHLGVGAPLSQLTWYDRNGKELGQLGETGSSPTQPSHPMDSGWPWTLPTGRTRTSTSGSTICRATRYTRFTFDPAEETTPGLVA